MTSASMRWSIFSPDCSACRRPAPTCATCSTVKRRTCGRLKRSRCFATRSRNGSAHSRRRLGGVDTLVFAGGIGENAPAVRARICDGLGFLGIELDEKRNAANDGVISAAASRVTVRVIRTDEERMIAKIGLPRSRPWQTKRRIEP